MAEVALASAPDVILPLRELTGLDLPDLHLSDLRKIPLPRAIPIPAGLPNPLGGELPTEIPLPQLNSPQSGSTPMGSTPAGSAPAGSPTTPAAPAPANPAPAGSAMGPAPAGSGPANPAPAAPDPVNSTPAGSAMGPAPAGSAPANPAPAAPDPVNSTPAGSAMGPAPAGSAPANPAPAAPAPVNSTPAGSATTGSAPTGVAIASPAPNAPSFIAAQSDSGDPAQIPGADPNTPALTPGAVSSDLTDKLGAEVKELSRDTPFSMVALTSKDLAGTKSLVRARKDDGGWGPWYTTDRVESSRDDHVRDEKTGTEPIFVGRTKAVQVLVTHKAAAAVPHTDDPAQLAAAGLSAVLIDPGRGVADRNLADVAQALPGNGPQFISRAQWGADESLRDNCPEQQPTYDDGLGGITVHHTAGRNDYTREESAGIVRAIYSYHAKTLGWCDIGYNALVDKYGQIFEGRFGGMDKPVQGAHAGGFNENTSGVAIMGDFQTEPPTDAAVEAAGQLIGWRARMAGLDPKGHTTMYSEGTDFTPYPEGAAVQLPIVFAHRDVGSTTCPGDAAYALMDRIRDIAAGAAGAPARTDVRTNAGANESKTMPSPAPGTRQSQRSQPDLAALATLTTRILNLLDQNTIAKYYAAQGGPNGHLGAAASEPIATRDGGQYVKFVNGYVYSAPDGTITEVVGRVLDRFLQLGAESGILGLPAKNAYPVPDGMRADFQYGSLILNTATGLITTLLKSYSDTRGAATIPAPR
ncbi:N-acetylmuramoyl-L-alanine amidase [Nocardia pseudobrasiliensis]|nr:N-acetylmuramoyl-L-alanine amidase [Nocardia pseudobrasiliensis]